MGKGSEPGREGLEAVAGLDRGAAGVVAARSGGGRRVLGLPGERLRSYLRGMTFMGFDRITVEPGKLGGKPCIRGMRISVQRVLEILAENPNWDDIRADYPDLEPEDIQQALAFAAAMLADDRIVPVDDSAA